MDSKHSGFQEMKGGKSMRDAYDWEENYRDAYGSEFAGKESNELDCCRFDFGD